MMARLFNFAAGPAQMPEEVLQAIRNDIPDYHGKGFSVLEMPFTGEDFRAIFDAAKRDLADLIALPESHDILFLQGGAYAHHALLALNLLGPGQAADYAITGHWSARAYGEALPFGEIRVAADSTKSGFTGIPPFGQWRLNPQARFCHITSNETADGVQFHALPPTGHVPLVADMTSDFLSAPIKIADYGLIYASAQKNIGPAGLTLLILRKDIMGLPHARLPAVFDYGRQLAGDSCVNTPPTFAVYVAGLVFRWIKRQGGLAVMGARNSEKSARLYRAIDQSGFYHAPVAGAYRSKVNVCFDLPDAALTRLFCDKAQERGLINLEGHGRRGGIRASLYNAMPMEGVDKLILFMAEFAGEHGRSAQASVNKA